MSQRRGWLWIVGGVILAILAGGLVFITMNKAGPAGVRQTPEPGEPMIRVVVAARNIRRQTVIGDADLSVQEMPAGSVPEDAILGGAQGAVGKIAKTDISRREIVAASMLTTYVPGSGEKVAFASLGGSNGMVTAREDQVLMAVLPLDLMSTQFLRVGSRVDLMVSLPKSRPVVQAEGVVSSGGSSSEGEGTGGDSAETTTDEGSPYDIITFYTIQNAEIAAIKYTSGEIANVDLPSLNIVGSGGEGETAPTVPQALLVALDPQDALILKHLMDRGDTDITVVLRAPSNDQIFDTQSVDRDYLYDRYTLPRP